MKYTNSLIWVLGLSACCSLCRCDQQKTLVEKIEWVRLTPQIPEPAGWGLHIKKPTFPVEPRLREIPEILVPSGSKNVALGQKVTIDEHSVVCWGSLSSITDGCKPRHEDEFLETTTKSGIWSSDFSFKDHVPWIQVDLGAQCEIWAVWFWHMWNPSPLVYNDVIVRVSSDPSFRKDSTTIYNNDFDNSLNLGKGKDLPYYETRYGKAVTCLGLNARYVRVYTKGSNWTDQNRFNEIEVYGFRKVKK